MNDMTPFQRMLARRERWERVQRAKIRTLGGLLFLIIGAALFFFFLPNLSSDLVQWMDDIPGAGASAILWAVPSALLTALLVWVAVELLD